MPLTWVTSAVREALEHLPERRVSTCNRLALLDLDLHAMSGRGLQHLSTPSA